MSGVRLESNGDYWAACWRTSTGRKKRRSLGPKSEISRRRARELCGEVAKELAIEPGRRDAAGRAPTLKAWVDQYLELRTDIGDGTRAAHRLTGDYLIEFFGADARLNRITAAGADDWRVWLGATKKLAEASVCLHVRNAKVIVARAIKRKIVAEDPFSELAGTPPKTAPQFTRVTMDDLERIFAACPGSGWRCLFALTRLAGLRLSEALSLEWANVDWESRTLRVVPRADDRGTRRETTKQKLREVPIQPRLYAVLRECFEAVIDGSSGPCAGVSRANLDRQARLIIGRAGIAAYAKPFHTLRKCLETEWLDEHPTMTVCKWLGHSPTVAAMHYQSPTRSSIEQVTLGSSEKERLLEKIRELEARIATIEPQNPRKPKAGEEDRTPDIQLGKQVSI